MSDKELIKHLAASNDFNYNILKAAEESSELTTALLQYHTKGGKKTTEQDVIEEIGDVKIRLKILENLFDRKKIQERYNYKLNKYRKYIEEDKYNSKI